MNTYTYVYNNPLYWIDEYGLTGDNKGVIGDPINRTGPIDQSGRVPRTGNPIDGPYKSPPNPTTSDKIGDWFVDNLVKRLTGIGGLITKSPLAVGGSAMLYSKPLGGCDENGVCSDMGDMCYGK